MRVPEWLSRAVSFADEPGDDDETRVRKRVGVVAGCLTIVSPLLLPSQTGFSTISLLLSTALAAFSIGNLVVLARTRQFDRYVIALVAAGAVFVPVVTVIGGGLTGPTAGLVWAFLAPAYAIMALGPKRAVPWFVLFLVSLAVLAVVDPWARNTFGPGNYQTVLIGTVMNAALPLSIVFLLLRWTDGRRRDAEARSHALLTNVLPAAIAARLRQGEERIAEAYPETTVLFADLVGFTPWANRTDPATIVELLDDLFTRYDALVDAAGVEKVKTVGDAYMAVAGAPQPRDDHAAVALEVARQMLHTLATWREDRGVEMETRIGLASGPVVAGVIGRRRLLFDLWGDTVNTASRMQSHGVPGRIQLAEATRLRLPNVEAEARDVEVKGLGTLRAYLVR